MPSPAEHLKKAYDAFNEALDVAESRFEVCVLVAGALHARQAAPIVCSRHGEKWLEEQGLRAFATLRASAAFLLRAGLRTNYADPAALEDTKPCCALEHNYRGLAALHALWDVGIAHSLDTSQAFGFQCLLAKDFLEARRFVSKAFLALGKHAAFAT